MVHFLHSKSILIIIIHLILVQSSPKPLKQSSQALQKISQFSESFFPVQMQSSGQNKRFLSNSCEINHCVDCSKASNSCRRCSEGFTLRGQNCTSTSDSESNSNKQMKIIIIMAFISVPLILVVFCCFIYLFFKRRPQSRQRVFSESIMTEMQMAYPGMPSRSRLNRENLRNSTDSFIGTGTNLIITNQNFETLFPVVQFGSEIRGESCTVCFEEFSDSGVLRVTPCKHVFHHDCLYQWLVVNDQKRCPNDNSKLC